MKKKIVKKAGAKPAGKNQKASKKSAVAVSGIGKKYLMTRPSCRVTFRLPAMGAPEAQGVALVGDFNNWDKDAAPMKRLKNGDFTLTLELKAGNEYRFRYLVDGCRWENDWCADRYEPSPFGCDDSVVVV